MSTLYPEISAGNTARAVVVFTPGSGAVATLGDVSLRYVDLRTHTSVTCTGIVKDSNNNFHCDFLIPDATRGGVYQARWESNAPSPHVVYEDETTKFIVIGSSVPSP